MYCRMATTPVRLKGSREELSLDRLVWFLTKIGPGLTQVGLV